MLLKITQTFNEQASTGTFVHGFMATYCHAKPLLAAPKAQKALQMQADIVDYATYCRSLLTNEECIVIAKSDLHLNHRPEFRLSDIPAQHKLNTMYVMSTN